MKIAQLHSFLLFLYTLLALSCPYFSKSQSTYDSLKLVLPEIIIEDLKSKQFQSSKKIENIDSVFIAHYQHQSLSTLLSEQSAFHIKSYGNGNIATSSLRGGNASHTALLWNGLNIQNPMLGQNDLSLVSAALFDEVALEYGGGSAMWGSGAIGGSIHLNNSILFNKGYQQKISVQGGSFDAKKILSSIHFSTKKLSFTNRVYFQSALNNYTYQDTLDKENPNKQMQHANYVNKGVMQDVSYQINQHQLLSVKFWYNNTFRNLPSFSTMMSKKHQEDENFKLSANYTNQIQKFKSVVRTGYFNDALQYHDSIAKIYSNSKATSLIAEVDNSFKHKQQQFNFGVNTSLYQTKSLNYSGNKSLHKLAFFAAYQTALAKSKLLLSGSIRKEFTSLSAIPLTGGVGASYQLINYFQLNINASKSFRQPSLNDLYYNPGGNPNLKSESSNEFNVGMLFKKNIRHVFTSLEGTYFNRLTDNWIIWLPGSSDYWTPHNIAQVYSRGTDAKFQVNYMRKHWSLKAVVNTAYVLSTNQKPTSDNDNSLNRQLIYTPRYSGNGNVYVAYKNTSVSINQGYTGYRFVTTDNTAWLNPYSITNIKLTHKLLLKQSTLEGFFAINNVFNKNYMIVSQRPMMRRNFEVGLTINYHHKKTTNKS